MNYTRLLIITYCSTLLIISALRQRDQYRYWQLMSGIDKPSRLLGRWRIVKLSSFWFVMTGTGFLVGLACAVVGLCPRLALLTSVILYFLYFGQIRSLAYIVRKSNLVPQILFVLALAPGTTDALTLDSPTWPVLIIKVLVIQVYVSAAYSKIKNSGMRWATAKQLQSILLQQHLKYDIPHSYRIASRDKVCSLLSFLILSHQLTFPIVLLFPDMSFVYVPSALLFHLGTLFLMRIDYLTYQGPSYVAFVVIPLAHYLRPILVR